MKLNNFKIFIYNLILLLANPIKLNYKESNIKDENSYTIELPPLIVKLNQINDLRIEIKDIQDNNPEDKRFKIKLLDNSNKSKITNLYYKVDLQQENESNKNFKENYLEKNNLSNTNKIKENKNSYKILEKEKYFIKNQKNNKQLKEKKSFIVHKLNKKNKFNKIKDLNQIVRSKTNFIKEHHKQNSYLLKDLTISLLQNLHNKNFKNLKTKKINSEKDVLKINEVIKNRKSFDFKKDLYKVNPIKNTSDNIYNFINNLPLRITNIKQEIKTHNKIYNNNVKYLPFLKLNKNSKILNNNKTNKEEYFVKLPSLNIKETNKNIKNINKLNNLINLGKELKNKNKLNKINVKQKNQAFPKEISEEQNNSTKLGLKEENITLSDKLNLNQSIDYFTESTFISTPESNFISTTEKIKNSSVNQNTLEESTSKENKEYKITERSSELNKTLTDINLKKIKKYIIFKQNKEKRKDFGNKIVEKTGKEVGEFLVDKIADSLSKPLSFGRKGVKILDKTILKKNIKMKYKNINLQRNKGIKPIKKENISKEEKKQNLIINNLKNKKNQNKNNKSFKKSKLELDKKDKKSKKNKSTNSQKPTHKPKRRSNTNKELEYENLIDNALEIDIENFNKPSRNKLNFNSTKNNHLKTNRSVENKNNLFNHHNSTNNNQFIFKDNNTNLRNKLKSLEDLNNKYKTYNMLNINQISIPIIGVLTSFILIIKYFKFMKRMFLK